MFIKFLKFKAPFLLWIWAMYLKSNYLALTYCFSAKFAPSLESVRVITFSVDGMLFLTSSVCQEVSGKLYFKHKNWGMNSDHYWSTRIFPTLCIIITILGASCLGYKISNFVVFHFILIFYMHTERGAWSPWHLECLSGEALVASSIYNVGLATMRWPSKALRHRPMLPFFVSLRLFWTAIHYTKMYD